MVEIMYNKKAWMNHRAGPGHNVRACGLSVGTAPVFLRPSSREGGIVRLRPINSKGGYSGVAISLPFEHVPELIEVLNRMIAGPLASLALDAEKAHDP